MGGVRTIVWALRRARLSERGFSLVEVLIAITILLVALMALAHLAAMSTGANTSARITTNASILAAQKMEQLHALAWGFDAHGQPLSDTTTDLTTSPPTAGQGVGLSPAPGGVLTANTPGYCDFLDASGRTLAGAGSTPAGTIFIRRWSVNPLAQDSDHTLVFQVLVTRVDGGTARSTRRLPDEARMTAVKTRTAS